MQIIVLHNTVFQKITRRSSSFAGAVGLAVLLGFSIPAMGFNLSELGLPAVTSTQWVAQQIDQNGSRMQVQTLSSELDVNSILAFFREDWAQNSTPDRPAFLEHTLREWSVISTLIDDKNLVVQVKAASRHKYGVLSEGFVSLMDLPKPVSSFSTEKSLQHGFPQPDDTTVISVTNSFDQLAISPNASGASTLDATTVLMSNSATVQENQQYYRRTMRRSGWALVTENNESRNSSMLFNKKGDTCEIAITRSRDGSTLLTLNRVEKKG